MTILVAFLVFFLLQISSIFACGLQCNEKRVPAFLPLVFASLYEDATRKTEWFFAYTIS